MSHLNVAYLYGMKRAAADFAQKLAELQATAPAADAAAESAAANE